MIVIGLILSVLLMRFNAYMRTKDRDNTTTALSNLEAAYNEYFYQNNRHPCPADPTLPRTDVNYGSEGNCAAPTAAEPAVIGMVPFKALNVPEKAAYDGWGNRLTYAVTRSLTAGTVLPSAMGALGLTMITYDAATGSTIYGPPSSSPVTGQFVLVSHGDNGRGAYNREGFITEPCIPATGVVAESDNCDGDSDFTYAASGRYYATRANNSDYYDDVVSVIRTVSARIWTASAVNRSDIYTKISRIGIGTDTPDMSVKLDVAGNIRGDDLRSGVVCDQLDPLRCFEPDMISGNRSYMECSGVMIGIQNGVAICANMGFVSGPAKTCVGTKYAVGFDASGDVICE